MSINLSGCLATNVAWNAAGCNAEQCVKYETLLEDKYIAIGKPSQPIAGYNNPLILIGEKSSLIISLDQSEQQLFEQVTQSNLMPYMHISLVSGNGNPRTFFIDQKDKKIENVVGHSGLFFTKPIEQFTEKDRIALEKLGFKRDMSDSGSGKVFYDRDFDISMTAANAINNPNSVNYRLKDPLDMRFVRQKNSIAEALILPAMIVDVITMPIQIAIGAIGAIGAIKK
ncbi:hypothetical protein [Acinetobacter sp. c3-l95]|uniref:hypothetical protein n=1 Tax=Acinetobacter sp. c3-l95 TaxID=3342804 RepID=UPI0035BB8E45